MEQILNLEYFFRFMVLLFTTGAICYKPGCEISLLNTLLVWDIKKYIDEIKSRYDKTASFRHDIKNHLTVLFGLLEKGTYEQARSFIREIETVSMDLSFPCSTNNPMPDILLKNKSCIAACRQMEDVQERYINVAGSRKTMIHTDASTPHLPIHREIFHLIPRAFSTEKLTVRIPMEPPSTSS